MRKNLLAFPLALCGLAFGAVAAPQPGQNPPPPPVQINTDFVADMLRAATAFNALVQNVNVRQTLQQAGVPRDSVDANGRPIKHAAAVLGAGAGAGAAIGAMTGKQKGMLIGAAAGGAAALIIDQIIQHREAQAASVPPQMPAPDAAPREPKHLIERQPPLNQ